MFQASDFKLTHAGPSLVPQLAGTGLYQLLTVIAGDDADDDTTARIEAWVEEHHEDVEVEVHEGGQPLYPYYFGLE